MYVDFHWLGQSVRLSGPAPAVEEVGRILVDLVAPPGSEPGRQVEIAPSPGGGWSVTPAPLEIGAPTVVADSIPSAIAFAELAVVEALLCDEPDHLHLHAGGIPGPDGSVVLVLGSSGAGKSTLAATAARTLGLTWGDDVLPLDRQGRVQPFQRPLKIHEAILREMDGRPEATPGRIDSDPEVWVHPREIGGRWGEAGAEVGGVVITEFAAGAHLTIDSIAPRETLALLLASTHGSGLSGAARLELFASIAERAPGFRMTHPGAELALTALHEALRNA